jgi:hypothetical protein
MILGPYTIYFTIFFFNEVPIVTENKELQVKVPPTYALIRVGSLCEIMKNQTGFPYIGFSSFVGIKSTFTITSCHLISEDEIITLIQRYLPDLPVRINKNFTNVSRKQVKINSKDGEAHVAVLISGKTCDYIPGNLIDGGLIPISEKQIEVFCKKEEDKGLPQTFDPKDFEHSINVSPEGTSYIGIPRFSYSHMTFLLESIRYFQNVLQREREDVVRESDKKVYS